MGPDAPALGVRASPDGGTGLPGVAGGVGPADVAGPATGPDGDGRGPTGEPGPRRGTPAVRDGAGGAVAPGPAARPAPGTAVRLMPCSPGVAAGRPIRCGPEPLPSTVSPPGARGARSSAPLREAVPPAGRGA
ncbi:MULTISPECIES: hypothetical protein [Streptomyces]|uniref:Uncharacterized protein n=1 Tax=Streptomyces ramulosus TaxID=47762 RepID=A0ABW1FME7_9ACTN